jgi:hypothetical protein
MNKYFLLSAAAVLASTAANASSTIGSYNFGTAAGTSSCTGFNVSTGPASVWSVIYNNCSGPPSYGLGLLGKSKAVKGKTATMSDNYFAIDYGISSEYASFTLPAKLKAGQPWELWLGMNGTTAFLANTGVLVANNGAKHRTGKSIRAGLKELIQAHRAQSKS